MKNIFTIFLLVVSCFYLSIAFTFKFFSNDIPGSGFFPIVIGITLIILIAFDLIKNYKGNREEKISLLHISIFFKLLIVTTVYIAIFNILGALLSTILFMFVVLLLFNENKLKQNIILGLTIPLSIFILFEFLLKTGLPQGFFENIF
ncbi:MULTISPECIES: tripartite tricarboxylate transporter TctB family protein [Sporosarcina]|uniref:tripartite tricarboxylate transporter TctB family protein n=1 Tax=Sporosarcina TaxID=1569 RepID=UPI00129C0ADB|nr:MULTISPECIES: tripartite tricarboxylate transporter TctB family protein [Sporosarcina]GKV64025.1 hypothetical protein NCCP2331_01780 [Sporosarcina sp. NCCP-2331]GLB56401.1 hypothetical protein NCCP2378_21880 [Sporosarcina sp. NCCP-2378]